MSKAYKCDICGNLFTENNRYTPSKDGILISIKKIEGYYNHDGYEYDICPYCRNELMEVIKRRMKFRSGGSLKNE